MTSRRLDILFWLAAAFCAVGFLGVALGLIAFFVSLVFGPNVLDFFKPGLGIGVLSGLVGGLIYRAWEDDPARGGPFQ